MMSYIATFFSHFGAIRFERELKKNGITGKAMPVPRSLSASCGTCVVYEAPQSWLPEDRHDEIEKIVRCTQTGYITVWQAENG